MAGRASKAELDELYKTAMSKTNTNWAGIEESGIDWKDKYKVVNQQNKEDLRKEIEGYITALENGRAKYYKTLETTQASIKLLEDMAGSDLSKLGSSASSASKEVEKYIGKLKEIYNILNRIQVLEHRLGVLDTYQDIAIEGEYGKILKERLSLNEELLSQYDFLVSEQKKFTNGYKDFINSVEGLEGVFDFDQYGQIIIN